MAGPDDELKELGDTFDALLARLEAAFGAQRQFVANASHELRTPLARQRALIEVGLAEPEPTVARLSDMCRRVLATAEQQERLIEALLTLARSQRGLDRLEHVDVAAIADELIETRQAQATFRGVTIRSCVARASAFGDARLIERLMANVLDNALRHNVEHGSVELQVRNLDDHAVLFVANSGPAIERSHVPRLFQPFERGGGNGGDRSVRQEPDGLGLGLSIVSAIASAHGAWLKASALTGGGLAVEVGFPRA